MKDKKRYKIYTNNKIAKTSPFLWVINYFKFNGLTPQSRDTDWQNRLKNKTWLQLTLKQHGFELHRSTYTQIFFFQPNADQNYSTDKMQNLCLSEICVYRGPTFFYIWVPQGNCVTSTSGFWGSLEINPPVPRDNCT